MKFSKEKELNIINDYISGMNTVEIAKKWNTFNTSIRRVLLRNNIPLRSLKEVISVKNPFKLGDEYSEYFLGLLLTDGCIHRRKEINSVSTTLSLKDEDMVSKFRDFINPEAKVSKILQKRYNTYMYSYSVRSDEIAGWLQSKGNFINKSYECDIYTPLTPHILRGIFDGDGYWAVTNNGNTMYYGICGKSLPFLEKIKDYLTSKGIASNISERRSNTSNSLFYLTITKTIDVLKVANLMYSEAHIFLNRKYEKWHLFEETLREKCVKFKEGIASPNPEPSLYKRFTKEGAETIIRYLSEH